MALFESDSRHLRTFSFNNGKLKIKFNILSNFIIYNLQNYWFPTTHHKANNHLFIPFLNVNSKKEKIEILIEAYRQLFEPLTLISDHCRFTRIDDIPRMIGQIKIKKNFQRGDMLINN